MQIPALDSFVPEWKDIVYINVLQYRTTVNYIKDSTNFASRKMAEQIATLLSVNAKLPLEIVEIDFRAFGFYEMDNSPAIQYHIKWPNGTLINAGNIGVELAEIKKGYFNYLLYLRDQLKQYKLSIPDWITATITVELNK